MDRPPPELVAAAQAIREGRLSEASALAEPISTSPGLHGLLASKLRQTVAELSAILVVVDHQVRHS